MKAAIITPWQNSWIPLYRQVFEERGHTVFVPGEAQNGKLDVCLHMWADPAISRPEEFPAVPVHLLFMRRFEFFEGRWPTYDWSKIDGMIFCNHWIKGIADEYFKQKHITVPTYLIYNAVDPGQWKFKERTSGKKIGMACHVHPKKNLPLAAQIMYQLPKDYELHIAGDLQDICTAEYLNWMGEKGKFKIYLYGHIPHDQLNLWWEQFNFCLSTSISEGNPNNVLEAMAKGIKPVVHGWPGAQEQFPGMTFMDENEATYQILTDEYKSEDYRRLVEEKYSPDNYRQVVRIAEEVYAGKKAS